MPHVAYIGLGANLGDRRATILAAAEALRAEPGVMAVQLSSLHETEPVGGSAGQAQYLNAAAMLETTIEPEALLRVLLDIETRFGRKRAERWGPRTLDLDLLLYDDRVINTPDLIVPHPRMHQRRFVLEPLAELAGGVVHPVLEGTTAELLRALPGEER